MLVPVCGGRRGHPLLFRSEFRQQVLAEFENTGLRGLLQAHPAAVTEWVTSDPAVLQDLDTPEDLLKAAG
jgi:molybdenum cofactor cytidylyltransferase